MFVLRNWTLFSHQRHCIGPVVLNLWVGTPLRTEQPFHRGHLRPSENKDTPSTAFHTTERGNTEFWAEEAWGVLVVVRNSKDMKLEHTVGRGRAWEGGPSEPRVARAEG